MRRITLADTHNISINDLYLGTAIYQADEEMTKIYHERPDEFIVKEDEEKFDECFEQAVDEVEDKKVDANIVETLKDSIKEVVKSLPLMAAIEVPLYKAGNEFIYIGPDDSFDLNNVRLQYIEPFSDYYHEGEYHFESTASGKYAQLDVDSLEPFEHYCSKTRKNMMLI